VHLQTQQPIVIPEAGEPEPDAAIVTQPLRAAGKPRAEHVSCVLEVAGTSLERDRTTKLRHHARGGIPQYVILDLAERTAEEHLQPDREAGTYGVRTKHAPDATLGLDLGGGEVLKVALRDLFPSD
jgi:Uma2 family endonuclease